MAHLRPNLLHPPPGHPHHVRPPAIVASNSSSNPAARSVPPTGSASGGSSSTNSFRQGFVQNLRNPPVYFDEDPENPAPAPSQFLADRYLEAFDLNQPSYARFYSSHIAEENAAGYRFAPGPGSDMGGSATNGEEENAAGYQFAPGDAANSAEGNAGGQHFAPGPSSEVSGNTSKPEEVADAEISSQPLVPFVGMTFDSIEEAQQVYNKYAEKLGFGTHIGTTKYSTARNAPPQTILSRLFECVHTGVPATDKKGKQQKSSDVESIHDSTIDMSSHSAKKSSSKQAGTHMDVSDTRQRNIYQRHNCKAHMIVGRRHGVWTVTVFKEEHTHKMMAQKGRRRFYRSNRKVPEEDFQLLQTLHNQNITTAQIMGCLGSVHGGDPRCLTYTKRDVSNIRTMLRNEVTLRDMALTIEYFKARHAEDPGFFYATQKDENNAVVSLFWVDGRTRSLYRKYNDCVFFDTTFCTNRYNMPFAPIVGLNNHTHTIVLGCALLSGEKIEDFEWVFRQWMAAMDGVAPGHIMTDQDQAMATAISNIFPYTIHRCCVYHVLHLARKKLGPNLADGNPFADAFYSCIYGTDTVDEYETCWQHMIEMYGMSGNTHLQNMWATRHTWAPVYFRKSFFPFTSTTGRSEGLNSYFKTLIRPSESIWNFVQQYELCQVLMLDREENSGFIMEATTAKLWGSYPLEEQGLKFYTREIFDRFRKIVAASTRFFPHRAEIEGLCFDLVPHPGLDVKTYQVKVVLEEGLFSCGCNSFEMCGLLCPHIIRVMVQLNVQQIPERYMMKRWSEAATTPGLEPGADSIRFGVPPTNTLKYNALCRKMTYLASDACFSDDTYTVVSSMVDEAAKIVATMRRNRYNVEQVGEATIGEPGEAMKTDGNQDDGNLQNPARVKPKGRPTLKVQRRKTLVEQLDDQRAKRRKNAKEPKPKAEKPKMKRKARKKKCPFCGNEEHIATNECETYRLLKFKEEALKAGAELKL